MNGGGAEREGDTESETGRAQCLKDEGSRSQRRGSCRRKSLYLIDRCCFPLPHSLNHMLPLTLSLQVLTSHVHIQLISQCQGAVLCLLHHPLRSSNTNHSPLSEKVFHRTSLFSLFFTLNMGSCSCKHIFKLLKTWSSPTLILHPSQHPACSYGTKIVPI